jgi:hypothetical protein
MIGVIAFLGYKLSTLVTRSGTTVAKKSFYRDLDKGEPQNYTLGNSSFDFAFSVSGNLTEDIGYFYANQIV